MILVTGATGPVGREVAHLLRGEPAVRILARDPGRVSVTGPGVETVRADYADHASLDQALRGVRAAFLVTNSVTDPDDARFVQAAREAGVRHVVKLSMLAVTESGADDLITRTQRCNEAVIRDSGLDWTFLRARTFMSNTLSWAHGIRTEGVVRALYGTSRVACVDPRDIACVAVRALTEPGRHEGRSYALSGPEAISAAEQTAQLAEVVGRPLRFVELTRGEAEERLLRRHPRPVAEAFLASAERQRAGAKATVLPTVRHLMGRPARTFRDWAADHAAAFA
ncbi:SDR family oxidoreductase [Streptomyces sp. TRM S81-3]|uniref:SDR family oxidoreductase n=1 Tax=Streptomyces griseicoloratus TaxID=2752516 RepID=A0A926QSS6_9ACTN|nr:SDR family oxidoreductase [Streptomyces griseicoloratus]MBD0422095.1 SDR family oxidoreductase [Streptomyces griseicoloratus]